MDTQEILYRRPHYQPLGITPDELGEMVGEELTANDAEFYAGGDQPPTDDEQFILALTPGLDEAVPWAMREQAARQMDAEQAVQASSEFFVEKAVKYEEDGDVLWA